MSSYDSKTLVERLFNETPTASLSVEAGSEIQILRAELRASRKCADDFRASLAAHQMPEGWALVPIDPTEKMICMGIEAYNGKSEVAYAAMVKAAPKPPIHATTLAPAAPPEGILHRALQDHLARESDAAHAEGRHTIVGTLPRHHSIVPSPMEPARDAWITAQVARHLDIQFRNGVTAGWNAGITEDTEALERLKGRVGTRAEYAEAFPSAPTNCPACQGNDADAPCAYPSERPAGCLRAVRLDGVVAAYHHERALFESAYRKRFCVPTDAALNFPDVNAAWKWWLSRAALDAPLPQAAPTTAMAPMAVTPEMIQAASCAGVPDQSSGALNYPFNVDEIGYAIAAALSAAPPEKNAEQQKYRAELYDEVWAKAKAMGYANVTMALSSLATSPRGGAPWISVKDGHLYIRRSDWIYPTATEDAPGPRHESRYAAIDHCSGDIVLTFAGGVVDEKHAAIMLESLWRSTVFFGSAE